MPVTDWATTVDGVAAYVRSRTKDRNGNEVGTFNGLTRPTDVQVTSLLADAGSDVADQIGWDIPNVFWPRAAAQTQLAAALLVELTYFPEDVGTNRSPYAQLKTLFDERLGRLKTAIADYDADPTDPDEGNVPAATPSYGMPADRGGMVGWRTRW